MPHNSPLLRNNFACVFDFQFRNFASTSAFISLLTLALVGCAGDSSTPDSHLSAETKLSGRLRLSGSSTLAPLVAEAAIRFEEAHPNVRILVQTGGSSRGIRDVHAGVVDVGMASRDLKTDELDGVTTQAVAWDGVAFAVHRDNPIAKLDKQSLRDIYTGKIKRWADLGGPEEPIVASNRAEGRSELTLITEYLDVKASDIQADVIDGETQQSIKTVETNRNAIVYTSIGAAQHAIKLGSPIKLLPLDGIAATTSNVQSGAFPVARPLLLVRKQQPNEKMNAIEQAFVNFLLSKTIDDITTNLGFVPPHRAALNSTTSIGE